MSLAIFDLDNTLIAGDSDHCWGEFLVEKEIVDATIFKQKNDQFYRDYVEGRLNIYEYAEFSLAPLTELDMEKLISLRKEFIENHIKPMFLPKAQALIDSHKDKAHTLLIITATNRFITEPIAQLLGIDNLLATEPEIINNRFTGKLVDTPCFQDGKVTRLKAWLAKRQGDLADSYFYSDSANDLPLLKLVTQAVAVNPDEKLEKFALNKGWPILDLR